MGFRARNGTGLVFDHESAITGHVGSEDRSKPSFDTIGCHGSLSLPSRRAGNSLGLAVARVHVAGQPMTA